VTPEEAIAAAEQAEAETAYRLQLARESYAAGYAAGWAASRRALPAEQQAERRDWEIDYRRWGSGGRAHFADPRPGDFSGRMPEPEPEPAPERDLELEAG
jgi:hypothetical protein